jgi:hypothetical protein
MRIKQLSIFVENKTGRLHSITQALSENGINMRALSIADTTDFGILRLIVCDAQKAKKVLSDIGVISKITDVLAVMIDDRTGGLTSVLDTVSDTAVSIEYMYAFLAKDTGRAMMVIKTDDDDKAERVLLEKGIEIASQMDI